MKYEYWLAGLKRIASGKKTLLRSRVKTAEELYYMEETQIGKFEFLNDKERNIIHQSRKGANLEMEYEEMVKKGIRFIPWFSQEYPRFLKEIPDYPYALYVKGNLPGEGARRAAVIGARRCTPYGEKYAVEFARALAELGVEIVSGMARGIDGMGHRGALLGGGRTYAVLGCGVDICYPKEHIGLYMDILEQGGGILSELPPGTAPLAQHFPARNRIISGLADAVLVMEAGRKSGSFITVDMALEQGRDVYALPGPVNSPLSDGCNCLIRQGAGILLSPEALAKEWGLVREDMKLRGTAAGKKEEKSEKVLETKEKLVYSCLGLYPKGVDQVTEETNLDVKSVMELLVTLELKGYIREISKNQYITARY